jgi:hypothetical protein
MAWKPEVTTDNGIHWAGNALRFATREEAESNVHDLMMRWMSVTDTRVVECDDPVSHTYVDHRLGHVAEPIATPVGKVWEAGNPEDPK